MYFFPLLSLETVDSDLSGVHKFSSDGSDFSYHENRPRCKTFDCRIMKWMENKNASPRRTKIDIFERVIGSDKIGLHFLRFS